MDTTPAPPLDTVVMAQQIQALTTNVQELMKQNESWSTELVQRAVMLRIIDVVVANMTRKLAA